MFLTAPSSDNESIVALSNRGCNKSASSLLMLNVMGSVLYPKRRNINSTANQFIEINCTMIK